MRIQPIGIDYDRFRPMDRSDCRRRLGWDEEETTVLFPAAPTRRSLKRWELASQVVEALQSRHGVHASLKFLMNVDPSDVPLYLNAADCVLVTSAWEAGPVVLTESLACGVPVVSVPVGYAAEMKQPMDLLYVAQPDPASLASTLAAVLRHPPRHERSPVNPTITSSDYAKYLVDAYCSAVDRVRRT